MKNAKRVAKQSQKIRGYSDRMPLYYSPSEKAVYTSDGSDRFLLTYFIRPVTEKEVEDAVNRFMSL